MAEIVKRDEPVGREVWTRDDAVARTEANDELLRRRGSAADIMTGNGGAEANLTGGKLTLGN